MKSICLLTSIALGCLLCCLAHDEVLAQEKSASAAGCVASSSKVLKEEKEAFYVFFCGERSIAVNEFNKDRSASGSISEQMVQLSRTINKLQNGQDLSDGEAQFLAESMRRDPEILRIYAAITTTQLFDSLRGKICRKPANDRERHETAVLKAEIERTIACGARF